MELEKLAERIWEIASDPKVKSEGIQQIALGIQTLVQEINEGKVPRDWAKGVSEALGAFEELADATPLPPQKISGLDRFVASFIQESQKRMAGLSLSINGVFDSDNQEAVRLSAEHLHAIRGGAAMLELRDIARLAGALEKCIVSYGKAKDLASPTRPILRAFAVLKSTIENPDEAVDALVDDVIEELELAIKQLKTRHDEFRRDQTSTDTRVLEQRILVVDDVSTIASSIGFILTELDIPVDVANSGSEALEKLRKGAYSLVISDVSMPDMDGYELVKAMKADEMLEDVPIILLTQLDSEEDRARGLAAGADDFLIKGSIGGGELVARVSDLLVDAPYVPTRAESRRSVLIVEDTETIAASIAFVLSEGPYDIEIAHNGRDALRKIALRDFDLIISDIEMPAMTGLELLKTLKESPRTKDIPFVVLTSRSSGANAQEAIRLGATRFLVKGEVGAEKLLGLVNEVLEV
ncbi:response regulator [Microvenator marinus]|uniref:Response regulator n=1 Tax=Microvenator marinus TaxID=2600177 RepID=A0A5B8XV94_9DELT|nr:response regulator [Microvenator marinus]QED29334.1 response regulator [Microvenator marinus]